jgi:hypothetical protein
MDVGPRFATDVSPTTRLITGVVASAGVGAVGRTSAVYVPLSGRSDLPLVFLARTNDDPARVVHEMGLALAAVEPHLGVSDVGTARAMVGPYDGFVVTAASVATMLGAIGLVVALTGLYGVLS